MLVCIFFVFGALGRPSTLKAVFFSSVQQKSTALDKEESLWYSPLSGKMYTKHNKRNSCTRSNRKKRN
jgi:hypothetical protein